MLIGEAPIHILLGKLMIDGAGVATTISVALSPLLSVFVQALASETLISLNPNGPTADVVNASSLTDWPAALVVV